MNATAKRKSKEKTEAIQRSIQKWDDIAERGGEDKGTGNCALCKLYWGKNCVGCPVAEATGKIHCVGSPYDAWDRHQIKVHDDPLSPTVHCSTCRRLARKEREFLKSLLPEGTES